MPFVNFDSAYAQPNPRVRMGLGEYAPPGQNFAAQYLFIKTLWNEVPKARLDLEHLATVDEFDTAMIESWAKSINLSDRWIIEGANDLVAAWREHPESRGVEWMGPVPHYRGEWPSPEPWNPLLKTEAEYDAYLADYKLRVREHAVGIGARPTSIKRSVNHFRWLVRHQVQGHTYTQIAQEFGGDKGIDESTVGAAIVATAAELPLILRPAPQR